MNIISHVIRGAILCVTLSASLHAASAPADCISEDTRTQPLAQEDQRTHSRAYPIAAITYQAIDAQHQKLVAELKLNTLARYGVKAATAALAAYVVYELWMARTGNKEYAITAGDVSALTNAQLTAALYEINPPRFSWQWFKNGASSIGWSVVNIALAKGVFDRGERLVDSIMHEGNLEWYVKSHTQMGKALVELMEYAHMHDAPGASVREHEHYKEQLMYVVNSFMRDMTALLGFMSYCKTVVADPDVRMQMLTLAEYCRITCNECADAIGVALESDKAVTPYVNKMSKELDRSIKSFMRLEQGAGV